MNERPTPPERPLTVEIVAELPLPELLLAPSQQRGGSVAHDQVMGMRILPVRAAGSGDDAWELPPETNEAIAAERITADNGDVAHFRVVVPMAQGQPELLLRCQLLHAHTASDASGAHWNAALHPTEEALIAITVGPASANVETATHREHVPIPGRAGHGTALPGLHTIRLRVTESGALTVSAADA
jgi:hypothetical protein